MMTKNIKKGTINIEVKGPVLSLLSALPRRASYFTLPNDDYMYVKLNIDEVIKGLKEGGPGVHFITIYGTLTKDHIHELEEYKRTGKNNVHGINNQLYEKSQLRECDRMRKIELSRKRKGTVINCKFNNKVRIEKGEVKMDTRTGDILNQEEYEKHMKEHPEDVEYFKQIVETTKEQQEIGRIGRNDPCPCGSGKKFKHCCLRK